MEATEYCIIADFAQCIDAIKCCMTAQTMRGAANGNRATLFIHQIVPH